MAYFEGTRQQIDDSKTPTAAVSVLIKSIILRLDEALGDESAEHLVRTLRDKLEAEKDGLITAISSKTDGARGPDAADSSEAAPNEQDPLRRTKADANGAGKGEKAPKRKK